MPRPQTLSADEISIADVKIERLTQGKVVHIAADARGTMPSAAESQIDSLLREKGGAERLKSAVRDISAKMNVPPPDIVLTYDPAYVAPVSTKVGNRNVIAFSQRALQVIVNAPFGKQKKWDSLEAALAHEIGGHLKYNDAQLLDSFHPINSAYLEAEYKRRLEHIEIMNNLPQQNSPQLIQSIITPLREMFRDELAILKPQKIALSTQESRMARELAADRQAAIVTGKPGALATYLAWIDKQNAIPETKLAIMEKAGVLDHPRTSVRNAQLQKLEQEMKKEKEKQTTRSKTAHDEEPIVPLRTPPVARGVTLPHKAKYSP